MVRNIILFDLIQLDPIQPLESQYSHSSQTALVSQNIKKDTQHQ